MTLQQKKERLLYNLCAERIIRCCLCKEENCRVMCVLSQQDDFKTAILSLDKKENFSHLFE